MTCKDCAYYNKLGKPIKFLKQISIKEQNFTTLKTEECTAYGSCGGYYITESNNDICEFFVTPADKEIEEKIKEEIFRDMEEIKWNLKEY